LFSLSLLLDVFTALSAVEEVFFFSFFSFFSFFFFFFFPSNPSTVCSAGALAAVLISVSLPELDSSACGVGSVVCGAGVTCTPFA
ncbi:hypothetical protein N307_10130, partial [Dryobates pubescens]